jgi:uncharacterized membrane protein
VDAPRARPSRALRRERRERLGRELRRRRGLRSTTVQLLYALVGFGLGLAVPQIPIGVTVPSDRATEALLAAGVGVVTFIGIVYSLLFLVVQFGSTTFTPRLNLFRDAPIVWHSFAFFVGILIFAFTAAFSIGRDEQTTGLVPITLVVLLLVAIALFRQLQTGAFRSIQLASTLAQVTERGRDVIDHLYPAAGGAPALAAAEPRPAAPRRDVLWPERSAVLQVIDVPPLVRRAQRSDVMIEFRARPGETLAEHGVVAVVHGRPDAPLDHDTLAATTAGYERSFEQDPLLALRVLADIALRALSPAINDPTTAVQALDAIDSLLRPLATRKLDIGRVPDLEGHLRVVVPMPTWDDFVAVAVDEIIATPSSSTHLRERLRRLLEQLIEHAPPELRATLRPRLEEATHSDGHTRSHPIAGSSRRACAGGAADDG